MVIVIIILVGEIVIVGEIVMLVGVMGRCNRVGVRCNSMGRCKGRCNSKGRIVNER
jgi:hypothetical protein